MAVWTNDKSVFALLERGIDGAKEVLAWRQFDADVLGGVAIVLADLRELHIDH